jgi:hypothetical protein
VRRALGVVLVAAIAWAGAFYAWSTTPASFDFIALYASARLVATGHADQVTSRDAILAVEHEVRPERTRFLNNPNPPAVSLLLAPLGALPFELAYALMLTILVAALAATCFLLAPLVAERDRGWLFAVAMLSPTTLVALIQGQTTPLVVLAVTLATRAGAGASGVLLAATALRPQFLPLFGLVALVDPKRRAAFVAGVAAVVAVSLAMVGLSGLHGYVELLTSSAAELRPGDVGIASLVRRVAGGEDATLSLGLSAAALLVGAVLVVRLPRERRIAFASSWSLLAAPHALPHDGVLAFPGVAAASPSTNAARAWAVSGVLAGIAQQIGLPIAALWLLALGVTLARERYSPTNF